MHKTMKAALITHYKQMTPTIESVPIPLLKPNDVLIKVKAASINPVDLKIMAGGMRMLLKYQMPLIIGNDFAGEIVAVGTQITQFKLGDAVYGRPRKQRIGTFSEYFATDIADIALKPVNLSYEEAAAIPLVGLTSYQALHDLMDLQPGKKVLIQAGAGGIGTLAIQLAKELGAEVTTTTSQKNIDLVKSLGADRVIDYHHEDFADILTNYDAVFDTLGGKQLEQAFRIVKPGGQVVSITGLPNERFAKEFNLPRWKQWLFRLATQRLHRLEKQTQVHYRFLYMWPSHPELMVLTRLIESNRLRPVVDRVFPFAELAQALQYSQKGHAQGKIVVRIGE